jgi:Yip1 domain
MATMVPELPAEQPESFASDLAGIGNFFFDPGAAAKYVYRKWFWVGPLILVGVVSFVVYYLMLPIIQHVVEITPAPANTPPEQYQKGLEIALMIQRVIAFLMPVFVAGLYAITALILFAMCSVVGVNAKFRQLLNLVAGCSVISMLAGIASLVILRAKGEISTQAELRPALGADIFMPEGANKYAVAFLGYFSVFEIWWIVMMVLILSAAFRVSKGKALAIILPLVLLGILFRVGGAAFQR